MIWIILYLLIGVALVLLTEWKGRNNPDTQEGNPAIWFIATMAWPVMLVVIIHTLIHKKIRQCEDQKRGISKS